MTIQPADEPHPDRDEYREAELVLLAELQELLLETDSCQTRAAVMQLLDGLLINLPRHIELEGNVGRQFEVSEGAPNGQDQVDVLRGEDLASVPALQKLRSLISTGTSYEHVTSEVGHELEQWLPLLEARRERERRMTHQPAVMDLGDES